MCSESIFESPLIKINQTYQPMPVGNVKLGIHPHSLNGRAQIIKKINQIKNRIDIYQHNRSIKNKIDMQIH